MPDGKTLILEISTLTFLTALTAFIPTESIGKSSLVGTLAVTVLPAAMKSIVITPPVGVVLAPIPAPADTVVVVMDGSVTVTIKLKDYYPIGRSGFQRWLR